MTPVDIGLWTVERSYREMSIDEEWSVRESRGFTWWGAWIRQRVWATEAVRSRGRTLWQVRARTAAYRELPDEPATYAFVNGLNALHGLSAYAYDPDDGTISARCGVLAYEEIHVWIARYFLLSVALQSSIAWLQAPAVAAGRPLDDAPHPTSGPRRDPDDMLTLAMSFEDVPSPFTPTGLQAAADRLASEGLAIEFDAGTGGLRAIVPLATDTVAFWALSFDEHPLLGRGGLVRLVIPFRAGPLGAVWLANALNLAETTDWTGDDRSHALGAWTASDGALVHSVFVPSVLFEGAGDDDALLTVRNLLLWATVRGRFAWERLPWLATASRSRYPDDEPLDGPIDDDGTPEASGMQPSDQEVDPPIPFAERSFGRASRIPRTRARQESAETRKSRDLVVDPSDPAAFAEIDDAVAHAEDGDRVIVRPGTYRRPVVVDRAIRLEGDGPVATIRLRPVGGEALGVAVSGATVSGLDICPGDVGNDGDAWSAVAVHDASVTIQDCVLSSHLGATVWVGGPSSRTVLRRCSLDGGSQNAVWVVEEGRAELEACEVIGHRWPMSVTGEHTSLTIRDSVIMDNRDDGVGATDGATLVMERTTVARNAGHGILLGDATPASRIEDCTVEENAAIGIVVIGVRGARILGNRVRRNDVGIVIAWGAAPTIDGNELSDNGTGIGVRGDRTDPIIKSNTIVGEARAGFIVDKGAAGRLEGNRISACGGAGIWVDDAGTRPIFTENHVSGCAAAGILVTNGAGGEFRSNDLRGNADGSWALHDPGEVDRIGNLEDGGTSTGIAATGRLN